MAFEFLQPRTRDDAVDPLFPSRPSGRTPSVLGQANRCSRPLTHSLRDGKPAGTPWSPTSATKREQPFKLGRTIVSRAARHLAVSANASEMSRGKLEQFARRASQHSDLRRERRLLADPELTSSI